MWRREPIHADHAQLPGPSCSRAAPRLAAPSLIKPAVLWFLTTAAVLIAGCVSQPERPADIVIRDAHSGGSTLAVDAESRVVASGGWSGWVRLWRIDDGAALAAWKANEDSVNGILFLNGGERLLTLGYDGRMAYWRPDGQLISSQSAGSPVTAFAAAPAADRMLSGHADGRVRLWTLDGRMLDEWRPHDDALRAVAVRPDGQTLASSGQDGKVMLWSAEAEPRALAAPPSDARTLAFSPDGSALYGGGWFRLFRWSLPTGKLAVLATDHRGIINSLGFLPDGRLASISRQTDSAVLLLNPDDGSTLERLQRHDLCGVGVAPSPDGRHLVTTSDDASVRIWHLDPAPQQPLP